MINFAPSGVMSSSDMNANFEEARALATNITAAQLSLVGTLNLAPTGSPSFTAALGAAAAGLRITRTGAISQPLLRVLGSSLSSVLSSTSTSVFNYVGGLLLTGSGTKAALSGTVAISATARAVPHPKSTTSDVASLTGAIGSYVFNETTNTLWTWNGVGFVDTAALDTAVFERTSGVLSVKAATYWPYFPSVGYSAGAALSTTMPSGASETVMASFSVTLAEDRLAIVFGENTNTTNSHYNLVALDNTYACRIYIGSALMSEGFFRAPETTVTSVAVPFQQAYFYSGILAAGTYTIEARMQRTAGSSNATQTGAGAVRAVFL